MSDKQFKNLNEQIDILKSKGLVVEDEMYAKEILLRENYFFINGYRHLFMKSPSDKIFIKGTSFNELYGLFLFDRTFRNILFKNLLIIENNIKSIFSYQLSKKYGYKERDYLKPNNFTSDPKKSKQVNDLIKKMKRQIRVNGKQHTATLHYISNYGYIPMWILVKVLSFGILSEFYQILKPEDQYVIAEFYDTNSSTLSSYLSILSNYRNICAHEDILFENKTQRSIEDTKYHELLNIPMMDGEYIYGKCDIFSLLIMTKQLLTEREFRLLIQEISYELDVLNGRVSTIPMEKILDRMGFPPNWKDLVKMSR